MPTPVLYVDAQSPYAYLAEARAARVLGVEPELQPIALGVIFQRRGHGSWAHTDTRAENVAALAARGAAAGLPPFTFPEDWPAQTLAPVRASAWAHTQGACRAWLRAYWALVFAGDATAGAEATLLRATRDAGLDPDAMAAAIVSDDLKAALRDWTDAAWDAGVRGIPSLRVGDEIFYGDDRLEDAARQLQ